MLSNDLQGRNHLIMLKKYLIESRRDFRFRLYSVKEPVGLGHTYASVVRKSAIDRIKNRDKVKIMSI